MNVAIIGTGAYGMALASVFYNNKCKIYRFIGTYDADESLNNELKSALTD